MSGDPYKNRVLVGELSDAIRSTAASLGDVTIMHVCGTHEHEIGRYGLRQLLPDTVHLVAGPGCPVCITPASDIMTVVDIALLDEKPIVCSYGDMVRVPTREGSLLASRADGADIRVVYSIRDAVAVAERNPSRKVVFFSVGFETTAAPVAAALLRGGLPANFLVHACHRYVPPAVGALAADTESPVRGFLLPGHAAVITGVGPYRFLAEQYGIASAVSGFEPVDVLTALLSILRQIGHAAPTVANCYRRAVRDEGNRHAMDMLFSVFGQKDAHWRGIGTLPSTGLDLKPEYGSLEAVPHFGIGEHEVDDLMPGCICHEVLMGKHLPADCALFGTKCRPEDPQGPCMVSLEGTCHAAYHYPEDVDA